ncbi:MAG: (2Fe-2S)-binding protein [Phycisphaeraceae bacterium]
MVTTAQPHVFTRCECSNMSFEQIKQFARENNVQTVKGLKTRLPMGGYCSACSQYITLMLKTGQTRFEAPAPAPGTPEATPPSARLLQQAGSLQPPPPETEE